MLLFVSRYINGIKRLIENFIKMYTENRYQSRRSFAIFLVVLDVLVMLFVFFMNGFSDLFKDAKTKLFLIILALFLIGAALVVDAARLKKLADKNPMNKKETDMLNAIALEKGINPVTLKSYDKDNDTEKAEGKPAPKPVPEKKKESASDLPDWSDIEDAEYSDDKK